MANVEVVLSICPICGFGRTKPTDARVPSFWYADFGWSTEEFVHAAIEMRDVEGRGRFDARGHRNQGYKGVGKCMKTDCTICYMMNKHGV